MKMPTGQAGAMLLIMLWGSACWGGGAMSANYAVWTATSMQKVLKTDAIRPLQPVSLNAARNEHEAFQIVLRSGRDALDGVSVTVSDLVSDNGRISASHVSLYLPAYIHLPRLLKDYPDPLPPYQKPFALRPGQTQPVWVDVYVPRDARPGN